MMHIGYLFYPLFGLLMVMPLISFIAILIDILFWFKIFCQDKWDEYKYEQKNKPLWMLKKGDTVYLFAYNDEFIIGKVEAKIILDRTTGRCRFVVKDTKDRKFVMNASRASNLTWDGSRYAFITSSKTKIIEKVYKELSRTKNKYQKRKYKDFMGQIASTL